ncbi:MAG TPA: RpiB/LacA/LacB family sugar-phosphate isomerase [Gemmataceae bacterium]|nr:RpiB/LacA/LacB family sugar-phosphate isomerase [Gemmataceae bacterium]
MSVSDQRANTGSDGPVLRWSGRVLTADDLRGRLNGQRELVLAPRTIVTPLAAEQLRANGVRITRQPIAEPAVPSAVWGYAQERPHPLVASAVQSLERDGLRLKELRVENETDGCRWAKAVAECVARGVCAGGVVFCQDPGLVCCVANKLAGLRAVAVITAAQAARAMRTLGANLVAVEMPGRTFFELRQILRTLGTTATACPPGVACILRELDGHAHR